MTQEFAQELSKKMDSFLVPQKDHPNSRIPGRTGIIKKPISQSELARRIGVDPAQINGVLKGRDGLKPDLAMKLIEHLPTIKPHEKADLLLLAANCPIQTIDQVLNEPEHFKIGSLTLPEARLLLDAGRLDEIPDYSQIFLDAKSANNLSSRKVALISGFDRAHISRVGRGISKLGINAAIQIIETVPIPLETQASFLLSTRGYGTETVLTVLEHRQSHGSHGDLTPGVPQIL